MPATTPVPFILVTAMSPDLREAAIDALRTMVPAETLLVLPGTPETLESDLAATHGAACVAVDLGTIDDADALLDMLEPHLTDDDSRFALLGILTMLDAEHFWAEFSGGDGEDVRQLIAQIESASLVVLARETAVPDNVLHRTEGFVRNLNPTAAVMPSTALATQTLATLAELIAAEEEESDDVDPDEEALAGEIDAWGFNSFTWTTDSPLDRMAFLSLFEEWPSEILRAHGVVHMDDGGIVMISAIRDLVTLDEYDELDEDDARELGSEESELAFVGVDLPVSDLVARLEACQIASAS